MTDLHQKLSVWAMRYKRREHSESIPEFSGTGMARVGDRPMCAMEVELRAMKAKADTSFDDAVAALKNANRSKG